MPTELTTRFPDNTYTSSAPLRNVVSVQVFHIPAKGICRGLLLRYADGSERTLNQCRISIYHRSQQYQSFKGQASSDAVAASVVCTLAVNLEGVAVSVARTTRHSHDEDGWTCHSIGQGVLHIHYTENREYAVAYEAEDRFQHDVPLITKNNIGQQGGRAGAAVRHPNTRRTGTQKAIISRRRFNARVVIDSSVPNEPSVLVLIEDPLPLVPVC